MKANRLSIFKVSVLAAALAINPVANAALPWFGDNDKQETPSLAPMLEKATPAVVNISATGMKENRQQIPEIFRRFFGQNAQPRVQEQPFQTAGSGVIIDAKKGYIVTNNHVIADTDKIMITLKDGRQYEAKKLGADAETDIALLQIEADDLTDIPLADSDKIRVGDFAVAIGNPFAIGQTVTSGIVSALGRSGLGIEGYENFIQTDAAINSGNSGGALVSLDGKLIGINTAILGPHGGNVGIGFAIPSNMMSNLVKQIVEFGEVKRGVLGISGENIDAGIAKAFGLSTSQGAIVNQVFDDTAAAEAGLKPGDAIISINGKNIQSFFELKAKIGTMGAGATVKLGIIRDGKKMTIPVTLRESKGDNIKASVIHPALEGSELTNGKTESGEAGVKVKTLDKRSAAAAIGLQENDVIVGVNRERINNLADLRDKLEGYEGIIALNVVRGSSQLYLVIR
ncbi:Do family serine endopeptidase [Catenovulum sp. 2E275]|uniref:Do family serine endopeptidase n=1 Tax=Catenovulum sp. 2E275 TaxID=2980497 RepID=UPI0021D3402F|nr:Do family serine endopeptidase [Catenovulum sp. 2E275]MCU4675475.1 Do family serine endopeptidase [Catenovulum sp. 2E275]